MMDIGRALRGLGSAGAAPRAATVRDSLRALKYQLAWARLRNRAARQGVSRDELERVRAFNRTRYRKDEIPRIHPLQNPTTSYFPGLRARPIYDDRQIAWTARLEAAYPEIKREALAMLGTSGLQPHPQRLADAGSWLTSYFYVQGEEVKPTHEACPATSSVLKSCLPLGPSGQVFFSILSGGAHIKPHCGPSNTRLTCHLGLVVPDGASIRVGTETVGWQEGKCLVFDDSFEHEVWNRSDERRIVLLIQFWHPDLTPEEIWALKELGRIGGNTKYRRAVKRGERIED
jgi:aspartyl/asparaginyl beta-hydroxylase (cupin superfamily)